MNGSRRTMSEGKATTPKQKRGRYSRLICLECRDRRIRCELPDECDIPVPGQLLTVKTPCHRCNKLGVPCIVRQTILGRPGQEKSPTAIAAQQIAKTRDIVPRNEISRVIIVLPSRPARHEQPQLTSDESQLVDTSDPAFPRRNSTHAGATGGNWNVLLIHVPQSTDTVMMINSLDTIRREKVENEWFRHLPSRIGHTLALDLSSEAIVTACANARGVPKLTSAHCYQAMARALNAVQMTLAEAQEQLGDNILAASALLAHLEGVIKGHGIPALPHLRGLAAIMTTRPSSSLISDLSKEIFDFHVCDSAIISCVHGIASPYEHISRSYYDDYITETNNAPRAVLKAIGSECFIRIPRLVMLVRALRTHCSHPIQLMTEVVQLHNYLLELQDITAKNLLLQRALYSTIDSASYYRNLHFENIEDFEALLYYWVNRLWLIRLQWHIGGITISNIFTTFQLDQASRSFRLMTKELALIIRYVFQCVQYAAKLRLRKHCRLFGQAILTIWGLCMDHPAMVQQIAADQGLDNPYESMLRSINIAIPLKSAFVAADIDVAASPFVGGTIEGKFAELYGAQRSPDSAG